MLRKPIPKKIREQVYQKYNGHCAYCGCELEYKDMQVDHVISVYGKDGSNDLDNLMPTCRMCNFYKSTYSLDDFRKNLETLHERLQKTFIYRLALKYGLVEEHKKKIEFYFERQYMKGDLKHMNMDIIAKRIVKKYVEEHLDKSDKCISNVDTEPYFVWKCKTLQNWKYLMSTDLHDGMYYELTYNGDKKEWYLDAYKKFENRCIPMPTLKEE